MYLVADRKLYSIIEYTQQNAKSTNFSGYSFKKDYFLIFQPFVFRRNKYVRLKDIQYETARIFSPKFHST